MNEVKRRQVDQISISYMTHPMNDDQETMTLTEWDNEEGVDVTISGKREQQQFWLSCNQIRALQILIANRRFV